MDRSDTRFKGDKPLLRNHWCNCLTCSWIVLLLVTQVLYLTLELTVTIGVFELSFSRLASNRSLSEWQNLMSDKDSIQNWHYHRKKANLHWKYKSKLKWMDIIGTIIKCEMWNAKWNAGIWSRNYLFHWTFQLSHNVIPTPLKLGANVNKQFWSGYQKPSLTHF